MGGFGPPAGSPFAGPGATGLPFAGVPAELQERVEDILETEPEHPEPVVEFSQAEWNREPFTLWSVARLRKWGLLAATVVVILETVLVTAGPALTGLAIDKGIGPPTDTNALLVISLIYIGSVIGSTILGAIRVMLTGRIGESLMEVMRVRVFSHLQRLSLNFFTKEKGGVLMTRMTSDLDNLTALFQEGLVNMFVQGLTLVIVTIVLFVVSPTLALLLIIGVVPTMLGLTLWFRKASDAAYLTVRDRIANVVTHENVLGSYRDANDRTAVIGAIYGPITELLGYIGQAMLLGVGGYLVTQDRLTIGELTAFFLYLTMFFAPIQQLVQLYNTYQQGRSAVRKLADLFATDPEVLEAPDAVDMPPMHGAIELSNVTFGYDPAVPVLRDVDLSIAAGETVAFVGETGAGKSTVAKLVNRFYDPTSGSVSIDGHDLRSVTLASLRSQIGVVPQEPFLFAGTIRDNLTFAASDADDDALWAAVDAVGLRDLVERQPDGLDQVIHERGSSLSSGERQLLALARAFLSQPRVLVLDEATSNLDLASETRIERALDVVLDGRTAIIIAHRLATARRADRIAVIHDGRVVELGSHDDLVALGGRYAGLYSTWMSQATGEPVG